MTFRELHYILLKLGYEEKRTGKTTGSRIAYIHSKAYERALLEGKSLNQLVKEAIEMRVHGKSTVE